MHYFDNTLQTGSAENTRKLQSLVMSVQLIDNNITAVSQMLESLHTQMQLINLSESYTDQKREGLSMGEKDYQALAKTMGELGRKVQRRDIGIAEFDKRVAELLIVKR